MPGQVPRGIRRVSGDRGTSARARCGSSAGSDKGGGRAAGALTRTVSSVGCSARGSGHMSLHQRAASWPRLAMILGSGGDDRERDAVRRCVMQPSCMLHDRVTRWRVVRDVLTTPRSLSDPQLSSSSSPPPLCAAPFISTRDPRPLHYRLSDASISMPPPSGLLRPDKAERRSGLGAHAISDA